MAAALAKTPSFPAYVVWSQNSPSSIVYILAMSSHSSHSARPLGQVPSFNSLLINIGNMPMLPDDTSAHRGRARLTSSPVHYHSPTRPRAGQSVHAYPSQGLMPPAQIRHGHDIRTPERSRGVRLSDREAAETLMIMRSTSPPGKQELSQNHAPALPSVERYERPKTPTRLTFLPPITPDRLRADSSRIHCAPSTRPAPSPVQLVPAQPSHPKALNNLTPIRDVNAQPRPMPIKHELPMLSLAPNRTLMPLNPVKVNEYQYLHRKWFDKQTMVPMHQLPGPGGKQWTLQSTSCFQIGERGLPLDKAELSQMGSRNVGVDVATPWIMIWLHWPGYPGYIGNVEKSMKPVHGVWSEIDIAGTISEMVLELQNNVHKFDATIDEPKLHAFEVNKRVTTRNLRVTHLAHFFENVYLPILCLC